MQNQINRGDIYLVNLGEGVGSIQGGFMRPVIIVSNNKANSFSPVIHAIPLTSKAKRWMPTHCIIPTSVGLQRESTALCEQIMLLPVGKFTQKIGFCDDFIMSKVDEGIMVQFSLSDSKYNNSVAN